MKHSLSIFIIVAALTATGRSALSSDPMGIYAIVDRVVLEPSDEPTERIQIWGGFTLAKGFGGTGDVFLPAARGYLYFSLPQGGETAARNEWNDLASVAGTGQCVAFASRYMERGRVRPGCEEPQKPDVYPLAMGVRQLKCDPANPGLTELLALPAPTSPPDGSVAVEPGRVALVVRNIQGASLADPHYLFEIVDRKGNTERSPQLPPGASETTWKPELLIHAGEQYTWKAWVVDGDWTGPSAVSDFKLPFLRGDSNGDQGVDLSDAVAVLEHLFQGGRPPHPRESGDADGSGSLDISDGIYLLSYLFMGGKPPPPPFPEPGLLPLSG